MIRKSKIIFYNNAIKSNKKLIVFGNIFKHLQVKRLNHAIQGVINNDSQFTNKLCRCCRTINKTFVNISDIVSKVEFDKSHFCSPKTLLNSTLKDKYFTSGPVTTFHVGKFN